MPFWDAKPRATDQECLDYIAARLDSAAAMDEASFRAAHWDEIRSIDIDGQPHWLVGLIESGATITGFYNLTAGTGYISQ